TAGAAGTRKFGPTAHPASARVAIISVARLVADLNGVMGCVIQAGSGLKRSAGHRRGTCLIELRGIVFTATPLCKDCMAVERAGCHGLAGDTCHGMGRIASATNKASAIRHASGDSLSGRSRTMGFGQVFPALHF